jgi:hypothetical protein
VRKFAQPKLEEAALRLLMGEAEGAQVGVAGLRRFPQAPAHVCPRRMRQVVVDQFAVIEQGADQSESCPGAIAHRHCDGAVQFAFGLILPIRIQSAK